MLLKSLPAILRQMGPRYVAFRSWHEIRKRSGALRRAFPENPAPAPAPSLETWRKVKPNFVVGARGSIQVTRRPDDRLREWHQRFTTGEFQYFNFEWKTIGRDYDWLTNPTTGHTYGLDHWTEIPDLDPALGDVKYVWEKSRFSYLLSLIRYDYHFEADQSELVFAEIDSWLDANPLNLGPNYLCSQEISLRLLNWLFALYYYQDSAALTQVRWERLTQSIYGQLLHVRANIHFSRIAVRNNHAITETLMLYVGGLLFPSFPGAAEWKHRGKAWFEEEIAYQVYDDGTFIQHSHNYHRVLVQLLSYATAISGANGERFSDKVHDRASLTLNYLYQCTQPENGELPNYGSNDGALFFPLADQGYRDYRPQLNGLSQLLHGTMPFPEAGTEEAAWLSVVSKGVSATGADKALSQQKTNRFPNGGIYTFRDGNTFTSLHCQTYHDRPAHADNLHLDLWTDGVNLLRDGGTYRYNTDPDKLKFFMGSASHNTVMLGDHDQMLKGSRFIWFNWTTALTASLLEEDGAYHFTGRIAAFKELGGVWHNRTVVKYEGASVWVVEDEIERPTDLPMIQHWNLHPDWARYLTITATDRSGDPLQGELSTAHFSGHYGELTEAPLLTFATSGTFVRTTIALLPLS
ncbi:alginate lyase family protein [Neolewinella antarctica]|uniref:Heparin-sulfate lyase N-terminal domain-containing protein n=1 Tax=Neolewinella antarctica TaxID=442734 RepID=A0ABX0XA37_9BACT|nr:alginate lyase family protein [Neolewinella antarctica]NJC26124.1 hypothetical protein [Neolewinella antarctica]